MTAKKNAYQINQIVEALKRDGASHDEIVEFLVDTAKQDAHLEVKEL